MLPRKIKGKSSPIARAITLTKDMLRLYYVLNN